MRATHTYIKVLGVSLAAVLALLLALPAAGQAARPNYGGWNSIDWSQDFSFSVNKKATLLSNFNPEFNAYWTLETGEEVWTQVTGISARISGNGAFSSTQTITITGLNRLMTVSLSGSFSSRTRASGTLTETLAGAGTLTLNWDAYGPERHKKKKGGHHGGGGGGGGGDDICVPIQIPTAPWWICT
jgi:hypothetical protein